MPATPVPPDIAAIERPIDRLWTYYIIKALMTTVALPVTLLVLYIRFYTIRYRFDAEGIRMSWGILFRREVMLNYSRIQDINVHSSFIERHLGLARIEIQTAAGSSSAEMILEGIADPDRMRDFLYSRMRGAAHRESDAPTSSELADVLREVAGEMRAIRALIEEKQARA